MTFSYSPYSFSLRPTPQIFTALCSVYFLLTLSSLSAWPEQASLNVLLVSGVALTCLSMREIDTRVQNAKSKLAFRAKFTEIKDSGGRKNSENCNAGRNKWIWNRGSFEWMFLCVFPRWKTVYSVVGVCCQGLSPWQPGLYFTHSLNRETKRGPGF